MKHGSMFTGIEGFGLGFELAGWDLDTVWQSEVDPFCLEVLALRFPHVRQLGDIREAADIPAVDVLTAGFPCQPVSQAGRGLAQDDPRWLWPQVERVIAKVHPRLVVCENVRGLRSRGLSIVLRDLARLGYDAQWDLLPAAANGAPHLRHRFWIVAYPHGGPYGRLFARRPPVFPWMPEEPAKPRLLRDAHRRRERLTALGNAVVPHAVAGVALTIATCPPEWGEDRWMVGKSNALSIESFGDQPPYSGALIDGSVFPLPTSAPKVKDRLWPTATANEGEWSLEAIMRCVDKDGQPARDPHVRHYNPDTGQIVQRTLSNYVRGVEAGLWPTPVASDSFGSRPRTARTDRWQSNDGVTLLDAVWMDEDVDASEVFGTLGAEGTLLWPTAAASDYKGVSQPGQRRGQLEEAVRGQERLWPTPGAADGSGKGARADAAGSLNPRWVEWLMGYPPGWTTVEFVPAAAEEAA